MKQVNLDELRLGSRAGDEREALPVKDVLERLYQNLPSVVDVGNKDDILSKSKYVRLAREYSYRNYRFCRYSDILDLGLDNSFHYFHKRFLTQEGAVLAIFNSLNDKPVSLLFRSLTSKEFVDYSLFSGLYGYDMIDHDFEYGQVIILTEGVYDADTLRTLYPNTLAVMTSSVSMSQVNILKSMSDKFICAFDSDDAGQRGFEIAKKRFHSLKRLEVYQRDKDVGVMEEMHGSLFEFDRRREYYSREISNLISSFGGLL